MSDPADHLAAIAAKRLADAEEALIQEAYFQIACEKGLTIQPVSGWGGPGRALVPPHWRAEATERAQPYLDALREVNHE